jgi:hypothetical protein
MTPYELAANLHRDLSPLAPRLAAALNRALVSIGEGSVIITPGSEELMTIHEHEAIEIERGESAGVMARILSILEPLSRHSSWRVVIDKKPNKDDTRLELLYTLYREPK